jgi:hypothetical protein
VAKATYTLNWRVASSDGHPGGGRLSLSVKTATPQSKVEIAQTAMPAAIARWGLSVVVVLGVRGAVFLAFLTADVGVFPRRLAWFCALVAVPMPELAAGLHGADMLGLEPSFLLASTPRCVFANATFGTVARGANALSVENLDPDFGPLAAREETAKTALPSVGLERVLLPMQQGPECLWTTESFFLPFSGDWDLTFWPFDRRLHQRRPDGARAHFRLIQPCLRWSRT